MTDRITADELASMFGETMPISAATLIHDWTGSAAELRGRLQQIAAGRLRAEPGLRVRHKKRGTTYEVIGRAEVQTGHPLEDFEVVVVYKSLDGRLDTDGTQAGDLWVRPIGEFEDGRFEELKSVVPPPRDPVFTAAKAIADQLDAQEEERGRRYPEVIMPQKGVEIPNQAWISVRLLNQLRDAVRAAR